MSDIRDSAAAHAAHVSELIRKQHDKGLPTYTLPGVHFTQHPIDMEALLNQVNYWSNLSIVYNTFRLYDQYTVGANLKIELGGL